VVRYGCDRSHAQLARSTGLRFYDAMRGGTVFILLGITAAVAYSVGHTDAPATSPPVAVATASTVKPVAFGGPFSARFLQEAK
jgi:hypothetical protein